jgi:hypothetical protein
MSKAILQNAARALGLHAKTRHIWFNHPGLEEITLRIAHHIGDQLPGSTRPLIEEAILEASMQADRADKEGKPVETAYAAGLLKVAAGLFGRQYVACTSQNTEIVWDPLAESVDDFRLRHAGCEFKSINEPVSPDINDDAAVVILASRLLPAHVAGHFVRRQQSSTDAAQAAA